MGCLKSGEILINGILLVVHSTNFHYFALPRAW